MPLDPNLIVFKEDETPLSVTVGTNDVWVGGGTTGTRNSGSYAVEVRAWTDNDIDTGKFELLTIHIIDPCLQDIIRPESPLPLQTYYIGSKVTRYDVQAISEPQFNSSTELCGDVGFTADIYFFTDADEEPEGQILVDSGILIFNFDGSFTIETNNLSLMGSHELHI